MTKREWKKFVAWFIENVFLPLLPLFISVIVDVVIHVKVHVLTDETILVYTIILPVIYLTDSKEPLTNVAFYTISVVGIILYTVVHLASHLLPHLNTGLIYHLAVILDTIYIVSACIYEFPKKASNDRPIGSI